MIISEMIEQLQNIKDKHGDLPVIDDGSYNDIFTIEVNERCVYDGLPEKVVTLDRG